MNMATIITTEYTGDGSCELTHGPTGKKILTDLPPDNGGRGRDFSPTDLFASSLASCVLTIMGKVAERDGLPFSGSTITIEKIMNESPRRVKRFVIALKFAPGIDDGAKKKLLKCVETCPVHRSLHPDIEIELTSN